MSTAQEAGHAYALLAKMVIWSFLADATRCSSSRVAMPRWCVWSATANEVRYSALGTTTTGQCA